MTIARPTGLSEEISKAPPGGPTPAVAAPASPEWAASEDALDNPFVRLADEDLARLEASGAAALAPLLHARERVAQSAAPRVVVFCPPKSGSSFVKSALQYALALPQTSLSSFASPRTSSRLGMNSREQELDDLAILKSGLLHPQGFVAQHHTRFSPYLSRQIEFFGFVPILTLRNVLDSIVSYDDMMMTSRTGRHPAAWFYDPQWPLPVAYSAMPPAQRYDLLARSFGVWLINFFLSWKRGIATGAAKPLVLLYERQITDPAAFVSALVDGLLLSEIQAQRLRRFTSKPDRGGARFNVGVPGRGRSLLAEPVKRSLASYAALFPAEITREELRYLIE